jgi:UrcA family protein
MSSNSKSTTRTLMSLMAAMLLAFAVVSGAHANEEVRSETVKFGDLNVGTPAGVQALYERIHAAARRVCSESDPIQRLGANACARKAEASAIEKLSLPQLTALYQVKTAGQAAPLIAHR